MKRSFVAHNFNVDLSGIKPQAGPKSQASSNKRQAPRHKPQASSPKSQAHGSRTPHKVSSSPNRGARQV